MAGIFAIGSTTEETRTLTNHRLRPPGVAKRGVARPRHHEEDTVDNAKDEERPDDEAGSWPRCHPPPSTRRVDRFAGTAGESHAAQLEQQHKYVCTQRGGEGRERRGEDQTVEPFEQDSHDNVNEFPTCPSNTAHDVSAVVDNHPSTS